MNRLTATLRRHPLQTGGCLLMLTLGGASGCADVRRATSLPPVNPESPVAAAVAAAAPRAYPLPRLRDVPPAPKNVQPAARVKAQVVGMVRCRTAIRSYVPAHPPLSRDAGAFAADARELAETRQVPAPPPGSAAQSEDLAARLRAFAAPPSAIVAGSPPASAPPSGDAGVAPGGPSAPPASVTPAAGVQVAAPGSPVPPLPPTGPDPLLARCS